MKIIIVKRKTGRGTCKTGKSITLSHIQVIENVIQLHTLLIQVVENSRLHIQVIQNSRVHIQVIQNSRLYIQVTQNLIQ